MKKIDYQDISNLKELRNARKQLAYEIERKEKEVVANYGHLKAFVDPVIRIQNILRKLYATKHILNFLHEAYTSVRNFFTDRKTPAGKPAGTAPSPKEAGPIAPVAATE